MGEVELVRAQGINNSFPRHSHQSFCLGLVERGCRVILQKGRAITIPAGSMFILQPRQPHACRSPQASRHSYSVLCLPENLMASIAARLGLAHGHPPAFTCIRLDDQPLAAAFRHFLASVSKGHSNSRLGSLAEKLISGLIIRHASPIPVSRGARPSQGSPEKTACTFLESHFESHVTLDALSRSVGLSPFHLQRRFLKSLGCTPKEYLLQHRIRIARRLLAKGLPLSQVALMTGFYDQGHFTNRFKRVMGVTPGSFLSENY